MKAIDDVARRPGAYSETAVRLNGVPPVLAGNSNGPSFLPKREVVNPLPPSQS